MILDSNEKILWKCKGNLKIKYAKIAGTFYITNLKIFFEPFLAKTKSLSISFKEIEDASIIKGLRKKLEIVARGKKYLFYIKMVENVLPLIKTLMKTEVINKEN